MKRSGPLQRHTPLAQGKGLKRSKRINPKRKTPRRGRLVLDPAPRQELRQGCYDRAGGRCEAGVTPDCPGVLDRDEFEWHHRKLRSQGGDDTPENSLALCHGCHQWAHEHPTEARALGLIVRSSSRPAVTAVQLSDGRIVRLLPDLTYDIVFESKDTAA